MEELRRGAKSSSSFWRRRHRRRRTAWVRPSEGLFTGWKVRRTDTHTHTESWFSCCISIFASDNRRVEQWEMNQEVEPGCRTWGLWSFIISSTLKTSAELIVFCWSVPLCSEGHTCGPRASACQPPVYRIPLSTQRATKGSIDETQPQPFTNTSHELMKLFSTFMPRCTGPVDEWRWTFLLRVKPEFHI